MNFYVRYMDSLNFRVEESTPTIDRFYNKGIYENSAYPSTVPIALHSRIFRANSRFGPSSTGSFVTPLESIGPTAFNQVFCLGCRYDSANPLDNAPARNIEWELAGSQLGWTTWDMTSKEIFKAQLITYYTESFNTDGATKTYFEARLGQGYRDLDYNVIIYWGYPLYENGQPYEELVTYECIYIGNTPLYDEIVAG